MTNSPRQLTPNQTRPLRRDSLHRSLPESIQQLDGKASRGLGESPDLCPLHLWVDGAAVNRVLAATRMQARARLARCEAAQGRKVLGS